MNPLQANKTLYFPFSAVAAQTQFKLALLLAAVNPLVGGVLVSGPRGSAKSTLAKGLADILPQQVNRRRSFIMLPLGTSEEMLTGTLNLQQVLDEQKVEFQPGLLSKAHEGVLYVDEVNLLPDNLVDQLLDVAASGVNTVERDGISHQHGAKFILLGTMNPDEGELRPQLIDRFGLSVCLSNQYTVDERIEIVKLREQFEKNPVEFIEQYAVEQYALVEQITRGQALLPHVECNDDIRRLIAERCMGANVDGLRADIVWMQAAKANAAIEHRALVTLEDVLRVEELVLNHRRKTDESRTPKPPQEPFSRPSSNSSDTQKSSDDTWGAMGAQEKTHKQPTEPIDCPDIFNPNKNQTLRTHNHPTSTVCNKRKGGVFGLGSASKIGERVSWFGSFVANAGHWPLHTLRFHKKKQGRPTVHLVLLDTSASILANRSFAKSKGLIYQIAEKAYLKREQFALLGFGNNTVATLLSLRRAPKNVLQDLDNIQASGGTPLIEAIESAVSLQKQELTKNASVLFKSTIITDGRVSPLTLSTRLRGDVVVVDVEQSQVKRGRAKQIALALNAQYFSLKHFA